MMSDIWTKAMEIWEEDQKRWWRDTRPNEPYTNQMILRRCPIREQNDYIRKAAKVLNSTKAELNAELMKP